MFVSDIWDPHMKIFTVGHYYLFDLIGRPQIDVHLAKIDYYSQNISVVIMICKPLTSIGLGSQIN